MIKPAQWELFFKAIESGASISDASIHSGIARESVYANRNKNKEFAQKLEKAILAPKLKALSVIQKGMLDHWQVAAWWLERKFQDEFAIKQRIQMEGNDGERPSTETLVATIRELREQIGSLRERAKVAGAE